MDGFWPGKAVGTLFAARKWALSFRISLVFLLASSKEQSSPGFFVIKPISSSQFIRSCLRSSPWLLLSRSL
jgi:hypothetical protein